MESLKTIGEKKKKARDVKRHEPSDYQSLLYLLKLTASYVN